MLLDRKHTPWLLGTLTTSLLAVGVYVKLAAAESEGRTAGSAVGLWYGILGMALMSVSGLLAVVRRLPAWRGGARPTWLRAHLWLGLLAMVFLLCHTRCHGGGTLTRLLVLLGVGVLTTGIVGVALQQVVPRLMTHRAACAAPGQLSRVCRHLRQRGDALADQVCGRFDPRVPARSPGRYADSSVGAFPPRQLRAFYETEVRPYLTRRPPRGCTLARSGQAAVLFGRLQGLADLAGVRPQLEELAALCAERRLLALQERLWFWLHSWLLLHVPLAAALLVLACAHAFAALYF